MLKREAAISQLILKGYDDNLATQLPKLFIDDFFEREQEKLSEALDIFIDKVQRGYIMSDGNNSVLFGRILKMEKRDMDKKPNGIFYEFRSHINEEFTSIVKRQPLLKILLEGGAMKFHPEFESVYFDKEIVGNPEEYSDLCVVSLMSDISAYIKIGDLYSLLQNRGFNIDSIAIVFGEYGFGPRYPQTVPNAGIYLKYDDVINLGMGNLKSTPQYVK